MPSLLPVVTAWEAAPSNGSPLPRAQHTTRKQPLARASPDREKSHTTTLGPQHLMHTSELTPITASRTTRRTPVTSTARPREVGIAAPMAT